MRQRIKSARLDLLEGSKVLLRDKSPIMELATVLTSMTNGDANQEFQTRYLRCNVVYGYSYTKAKRTSCISFSCSPSSSHSSLCCYLIRCGCTSIRICRNSSKSNQFIPLLGGGDILCTQCLNGGLSTCTCSFSSLICPTEIGQRIADFVGNDIFSC